MKQCKNCGAPMEDFAAFCPQCAAPADQNVQTADNSAYQTPQNNSYEQQQPQQNNQFAQQPPQQYVQQPIQNDPYVQQPVGYNAPMMPNMLPDKSAEVLSVGKYIGMFILSSIPVVNIICWIIWLANANTNKNVKNFVIAQIVMFLIAIVLIVVSGLIFGFGAFAFLDSLSSSASSSGEYASALLSLLNL